MGLALEGNASETCDEWRLSFPLNFYFQTDIVPVWGGNRGVIFAYHLTHAAFVLTCQCFEQGYSHDAVQVPQPGDILRQLVVLDKSSIFRLIATDNTVITVEHEFSSLPGFPSTFVESTFLLNDLCWDAQSNLAIHTAAAMLVVLVLDVLDKEFIAKKVRRFSRCMCNERFLLRQF